MSGAGGRQTGEGEGPAETPGGSAPEQGHSHASTLGAAPGWGDMTDAGPGPLQAPITPSPLHTVPSLGAPRGQAQCQALRPPPIGSL